MFPVWGSDRRTIRLVWTDDCEEVELIEYADSAEGRDAFTDLHSLVEDAAADLDHLQVLLLLVPRTLDVRHPAPLVLLTGIDEIPDGPVLVKHLRGGRREHVVMYDVGHLFTAGYRNNKMWTKNKHIVNLLVS